MPELGLATIDTSVQETNRWLDALMSELGTHDKQYAFQTLRAVLTTLRDRLPLDQCARFGAQLPLLIRGLYYEGFVPADVPKKYRRADEWRQAIARASTHIGAEQAGIASRAVFRVLDRELDAGLMNKIGESLPDDIHAVVLH